MRTCSYFFIRSGMPNIAASIFLALRKRHSNNSYKKQGVSSCYLQSHITSNYLSGLVRSCRWPLFGRIICMLRGSSQLGFQPPVDRNVGNLKCLHYKWLLWYFQRTFTRNKGAICSVNYGTFSKVGGFSRRYQRSNIPSGGQSLSFFFPLGYKIMRATDFPALNVGRRAATPCCDNSRMTRGILTRLDILCPMSSRVFSLFPLSISYEYSPLGLRPLGSLLIWVFDVSNLDPPPLHLRTSQL